MEKLIKIAEINAESVKSANEIGEALENAGFQVAYEEDESLKSYLTVIKKIQ